MPFSASRPASTIAILSSGRSMRSPIWTIAIVTIWPTAAIQRSWISSIMFLRLVTSLVAGAARFAVLVSRSMASAIARDAQAQHQRHHREREPGDHVLQMAVSKLDDGETGNRWLIGVRLAVRFRVDEIGRGTGEMLCAGDGVHVARIP